MTDYVPPYPLVEVIWDDAASNSETWVTIADIEGPEQVRTVGFLVKDTDKFVAVAGSVSNEDLHEDTVGNTITVPRGMIVSMRTLRKGGAVKKKAKRRGAKPQGAKPQQPEKPNVDG